MMANEATKATLQFSTCFLATAKVTAGVQLPQFKMTALNYPLYIHIFCLFVLSCIY